MAGAVVVDRVLRPCGRWPAIRRAGSPAPWRRRGRRRRALRPDRRDRRRRWRWRFRRRARRCLARTARSSTSTLSARLTDMCLRRVCSVSRLQPRRRARRRPGPCNSIDAQPRDRAEQAGAVELGIALQMRRGDGAQEDAVRLQHAALALDLRDAAVGGDRGRIDVVAAPPACRGDRRGSARSRCIAASPAGNSRASPRPRAPRRRRSTCAGATGCGRSARSRPRAGARRALLRGRAAARRHRLRRGGDFSPHLPSRSSARAARLDARRALTSWQDVINNAFTLTNSVLLALAAFLPFRVSEARELGRGHMKIVLRVDRGALRRWHLALAERLAKRTGAEIGFRLEAGAPAAPSRPRRCFRLRHCCSGLARGGLASGCARKRSAGSPTARDAYLIVDLGAEPLGDVRSGVGGSSATALAWSRGCSPPRLAAARRPCASRPQGTVGDGAAGRAKGGVSSRRRSRRRLRTGRDADRSRARGAAAAVPPPIPGEPPTAFDAAGADEWTVRGAGAEDRDAPRAVRAVYRALCHAPHWRVGWRRGEGAASPSGSAAAGSICPTTGGASTPIRSRSSGAGARSCSSRSSSTAAARASFRSVEFGADGPLGDAAAGAGADRSISPTPTCSSATARCG